MVNVSWEKSGLPAIAAISGVRISFTNACTTATNAAPIIIATARSTTLPRSKNWRNPLIVQPPASFAGESRDETGALSTVFAHEPLTGGRTQVEARSNELSSEETPKRTVAGSESEKAPLRRDSAQGAKKHPQPSNGPPGSRISPVTLITAGRSSQ